MASLIIDTDVGHDDLFAIGMLLKQHVENKLRIHAFTTVKGLTTPVVGYQILKRLLSFCHLEDEIRVVCGYDSAFDQQHSHLFTDAAWMTDELRHKFEHVADDIVLPPFVGEEPKHNVVSSVLQWIADAEDQTYQLLCLGPLTNLAYMSQQDPTVLSRFSVITMMAGFVYSDRVEKGMPEHAEYNLYADPLAAYQSDLEYMKEQISSTIDNDVERSSLEAVTEFLRRMYYYSPLESISFDSIAVTRLFQPELFLEDEELRVRVDPFPPLEGRIVVDDTGAQIILPVSFDKHGYLLLLKQILQIQ